MKKHIVTVENAQKISEWLQTRGGLFIWQSVNLANPGQTWTTPARTEAGEAYTTPTWQCGNAPIRHITDAADVVVSIDKELKRVKIALRMASGGMSIKLTDHSSQKVRKAVAAAGEGAYYLFDDREAVIMVPDKQMPLTEYLATLAVAE